MFQARAALETDKVKNDFLIRGVGVRFRYYRFNLSNPMSVVIL